MSKVSELLIKIINSETCEVGKDHCFPDEPLIHNRPCHRCSSKDDCFVIESIDALDELEHQSEPIKKIKQLRKWLVKIDHSTHNMLYADKQKLLLRLVDIQDWCEQALSGGDSAKSK